MLDSAVFDEPDPDPNGPPQMATRLADILSSPHQCIGQYFFPLTAGSDSVDRALCQERLTPFVNYIRDMGSLEPQETSNLCRVMANLRKLNHPELLAALTSSKADEHILRHLPNSQLVQEIIEGVFLNLSFKNVRSARNITSPAEVVSATEGGQKPKAFDFADEISHTYNGKLSDKQTDDLPRHASTFLSNSQRSVSLVSSKAKSRNFSNVQEPEKSPAKRCDNRISLLYKIADQLLQTSDELVIRNAADLFSSLLVQSKTGTNLRVILEEVLYHAKFQEKLTAMLFKSTQAFKYVQVAALLVRLITHHEDYFFFRNRPEGPVKLSPPFYRFMNDCIDPLNAVLAKARSSGGNRQVHRPQQERAAAHGQARDPDRPGLRAAPAPQRLRPQRDHLPVSLLRPSLRGLTSG